MPPIPAMPPRFASYGAVFCSPSSTHLWDKVVKFPSTLRLLSSTSESEISLSLLAVIVVMPKAENRSLFRSRTLLRWDELSDDAELLSLSSETELLSSRLIDSGSATEMSACTDVIWVYWDDDTRRQELHAKEPCSVAGSFTHVTLDPPFR